MNISLFNQLEDIKKEIESIQLKLENNSYINTVDIETARKQVSIINRDIDKMETRYVNFEFWLLIMLMN